MINRRRFLYGAGSLVSLPFFESISYGNFDTKINRAIFVFSPNGMNMNSWNINSDQKDLSVMSSTLKPLEKFKDRLVVYSGLAQTKARANGDGAGDHARSMSTFLTGVQIKKTDGINITAGISVDQIAANYFRSYTRIPSLAVGCESSKTAGNCDSGYSCAYSSTISWAGPHSPLPKDINPASIFNTIYGDGSKSNNLDTKKSILDYSLEQASSLRRSLNDYDQRKLDEYLNSIREIERKIQLEKLIPKEQSGQREIFSNIPSTFSSHAKILIDLIILAFLTDSSRIATIALTNEGSNKSYSEIEVGEGHHDLSHHQNDEEKLEKLSKINLLHSQQVAYLFEKLQENNLLNSTIISYGCGIEDGNTHAHHNLPILVGGDISGNRHEVLPKETPLNNLWLGVLDHIGVKLTDKKFGDSNNIIQLT
jgi:hypothetical protein